MIYFLFTPEQYKRKSLSTCTFTRYFFIFVFAVASLQQVNKKWVSICLLSHRSSKGLIFLEKYWYYFHFPKNELYSILSFVFWIFPPLDTAVQLESADSKQNAISKSLFQDIFWHIFLEMRKMHNTFWLKGTFNGLALPLHSIEDFEVEPRSSRLPCPRACLCPKLRWVGLSQFHQFRWKSKTMVFCYHNCSNVLWEKIVLVWGKKLRKKFANSRP